MQTCESCELPLWELCCDGDCPATIPSCLNPQGCAWRIYLVSEAGKTLGLGCSGGSLAAVWPQMFFILQTTQAVWVLWCAGLRTAPAHVLVLPCCRRWWEAAPLGWWRCNGRMSPSSSSWGARCIWIKNTTVDSFSCILEQVICYYPFAAGTESSIPHKAQKLSSILAADLIWDFRSSKGPGNCCSL